MTENKKTPANEFSLVDFCDQDDLFPTTGSLILSGKLPFDENGVEPVREANLHTTRALLSVWSRMLFKAHKKKMLSFSNDKMVLCPKAEGKSYIRRLLAIPKYEIFFGLGENISVVTAEYLLDKTCKSFLNAILLPDRVITRESVLEAIETRDLTEFKSNSYVKTAIRMGLSRIVKYICPILGQVALMLDSIKLGLKAMKRVFTFRVLNPLVICAAAFYYFKSSVLDGTSLREFLQGSVVMEHVVSASSAAGSHLLKLSGFVENVGLVTMGLLLGASIEFLFKLYKECQTKDKFKGPSGEILLDLSEKKQTKAEKLKIKKGEISLDLSNQGSFLLEEWLTSGDFPEMVFARYKKESSLSQIGEVIKKSVKEEIIRTF